MAEHPPGWEPVTQSGTQNFPPGWEPAPRAETPRAETDPPLTVESTKDRPKLGEMPWAPTVRQWGKDRPGLLGDFARSLIPTTGARLGTDIGLAATAPVSGIPGILSRIVAAGAGAYGGAKATDAPRPGKEAMVSAIETGGGEAAMSAAEPLVTRGKQMWKFGTVNPREAGRAAKAEVAAGRKSAEEVAAESTRLQREAAQDTARQATEQGQLAAREQTAAGRRAAEETADVANRMRRDAKTKGVAADMGSIIPELEAQPGELYGAAFTWGKPQLDRVFDAEIDAVKQRVGDRQWFKVEQLNGGRPMSFNDARTALAELGSGIGQAGRTVRSSGQAYTAADYRAARDAIQSQLNQVDQFLHPMMARYSSGNVAWAGEVWDEAMKSRAAGRSYLTVLQKAMDEHGVLDPDKLERIVNKNSEKLREKFGRAWDVAESALLGGRQAPVQAGTTLKPLYPEPVRAQRVRPMYPPEVQPVYPRETPAFRFSPTARAAADIMATDPMVAGAGLGMAEHTGMSVMRLLHNLGLTR
jgi:hypothetical protein